MNETSTTRGPVLAFALTAIVHYAALIAYVLLWSNRRSDDLQTSVIFFIGLIAWMGLLGLHLYFRKRDHTASRLSLVCFVASLAFGILCSSPTD